MSTRSRIGIETDDGIRSVYCHFDGYPGGVGKSLRDRWSDDRAEVAEMIEHGDMSSLDDGDSPTEFYADRGETNVDPVAAADRDAFFSDAQHSDAEYAYLLTDDGWVVWNVWERAGPIPLADAIARWT